MPIVGLNFEKITAEKTSTISGEVQVKNNVRIKDVKTENIAIKKSDETLKFSFEYAVNYEPNLGNITLEGHVLYVEDPKKIKEILAAWKKDKKITPGVMQSIMNHIIVKCSIKALTLSQETNLPPHLPLPTLREEGKRPEDYIG